MITISAVADAELLNDLAFAAEGSPAAILPDLIEQLGTAAHTLGYYGGIHGAEDLRIAAQYLSDAMDSEGAEREALLKRAASCLRAVPDMVEELRLMV